MISPYVRRRRLAAELKQLMEEHGYSGLRLADACPIQVGIHPAACLERHAREVPADSAGH